MARGIETELCALDAYRPDRERATPHAAPLGLGLGLGFYGAICVGLLAFILAQNDGVFVYTLDDPYIHLALARTLWFDGVYGIGAHEASAPSSSIVWPFLLAPFAATPVFEYAPLAINMMLAAAILWVVARGTHEFAPDATLARFAALGAIILLNLPGLTFNGMEHMLQVFVTLFAVFGVIRAVQGGDPGRIAVLATIVLPLIRYEGAAVTFAACVAYVLVGARRRAAVIAVACGALIGAFSLYLMSLGLGPLPSSVLVKTEFERGPILNLLLKLFLNYDYGPFYTVAMAAGLAAYIVIRYWRPRRSLAVLALTAFIAAGLHIAFGRFAWLARYEVYLVAAILPLLLVAAPELWPRFRAALAARGRRPICAALICGLAVTPLVARYVWDGIVRTPIASHSIYAQQFQMTRFVAQNQIGAVAVNDLGWIAYASGARVLDLWGLGSEQARRARLARDPRWVEHLLARNPDVTLAMIYEEWLPGPYPESWVKLGELVYTLPLRPIAPAVGATRVSFFATSAARAADLRAAFAAFAATLPRSATIELAPAP
jgi:hypothetical protein